MQLLRALRPFHGGLLLVGLNPLVVSRSGRCMRICRRRQLYQYCVAVLLVPVIIFNIARELLDISANTGRLQTRVIVQVVEASLLMAAYIVVLIFGLWSPLRKCTFLNGLHRTCGTADRPLIRAIFRRAYGETIGLNAVHLSLIVWLEWRLQHYYVYTATLCMLVLTVNIEVLHIRAVVQVLAGRMRTVRQRLAGACGEPTGGCGAYALVDTFDQLDRLWQLRQQFEDIFGAFLGVHLTLDLIMVTMVLFLTVYFMVYVGGTRVLLTSVAAVSARVVPVAVKMTLLVRPFVRVAWEVSIHPVPWRPTRKSNTKPERLRPANMSIRCGVSCSPGGFSNPPSAMRCVSPAPQHVRGVAPVHTLPSSPPNRRHVPVFGERRRSALRSMQHLAHHLPVCALLQRSADVDRLLFFVARRHA